VAGATATTRAGYTPTLTPPPFTPTPPEFVPPEMPAASAQTPSFANPVPGNPCDAAQAYPTPGLVNTDCSDMGYWYAVKVSTPGPVNIYVYSAGNSGAVAAVYRDNPYCPGIFQPQPSNGADSLTNHHDNNILVYYQPRNDTLDANGYNQGTTAYAAPWTTYFKLFQPGPNPSLVSARQEVDLGGIAGSTDAPPTVTASNCLPASPTPVPTYDSTPPASALYPTVQAPSTPPALPGSAETAATDRTHNDAFSWEYLGQVNPATVPAVYYVQVKVWGGGTGCTSDCLNNVPDSNGNAPFKPGDVYDQVVNNFAIGAFPVAKGCPLCASSPPQYVADYPTSTTAPNLSQPFGPSNPWPSFDGEAPAGATYNQANTYLCNYANYRANAGYLCTVGEQSVGQPFACATSAAGPFTAPNADGTCPSGETYQSDPSWPLVYGDGTISNYVPQVAGTPPPTATATNTPLPGAIPSPWLTTNVGTVTPGTDTYEQADGQFTLSAASAAISSTPMAYHYVYQPITGGTTAQIIAHVGNLTGGTSAAQAGLVLTTDPTNASAAFMDEMLTAGGTQLQFQAYTGSGSIVGTTQAIAQTNAWLKLNFSGNTYAVAYSLDGANWTTWQQGTSPSTPNAIYVGLAVTSGSSSTPASATFDGVDVSGSGIALTATPTLTPDPTPITGGSLITLGDVPQKYAGRTLEIQLFDPGDVVNCANPGSAWMEIVPPDEALGAVDPPGFNYTVTSNTPGDAGYGSSVNGVSSTDVRGQQSIQVADTGVVKFNGSWLNIQVHVPPRHPGYQDDYLGGYWKIRYVLYGPTLPTDRMTWKLKVQGAPVYLVQ
jgi:hypothetical protein